MHPPPTPHYPPSPAKDKGVNSTNYAASLLDMRSEGRTGHVT